MNLKITKSAFLIALLGFSGSVMAQTTTTTTRFDKQSYRTWSIGAHGGILSQNTIFGGNSERADEFSSIGYGGFIKKQILPSLGLQVDYLRGDVKTYVGATSKFENSIKWSGALTAVLNVANFSFNDQNAVLIPYVKAGAGYMSSSADLTTGSTTTNVYANREGWFIPVGAGFKLGVAKGINLDFGYDVNFVKSSPTVKSSFNESRFGYAHA
ncbi:MAG: OmpA family protein, partial [Flavobacterium sp.]